MKRDSIINTANDENDDNFNNSIDHNNNNNRFSANSNIDHGPSDDVEFDNNDVCHNTITSYKSESNKENYSPIKNGDFDLQNLKTVTKGDQSKSPPLGSFNTNCTQFSSDFESSFDYQAIDNNDDNVGEDEKDIIYCKDVDVDDARQSSYKEFSDSLNFELQRELNDQPVSILETMHSICKIYEKNFYQIDKILPEKDQTKNRKYFLKFYSNKQL